MAEYSVNGAGSGAGRRIVRALIAVVGLVLVRLFIARLPMVQNANPILMDSLFGSGYAVITIEALIEAIIDTLIFAVVLLAAFDIARNVRQSARIPDTGLMGLFAVCVVVVVFAYRSYAGTLLPILGDQSVYDWLFLLLGLAPLAALVFIVYRNLDALTDMAFHSGRQAMRVVGQAAHAEAPGCPKCGAAVPADAKFCPHCGEPASAAATPEIFCAACGARNKAVATHCESCGKVLIR